MTDDFRFMPKRCNTGKQYAVDSKAAGGNPTAIDSLEVLCENDEVDFIYHNANNPNNNGVVMHFGTKRTVNFLLESCLTGYLIGKPI